MTHADWRLVAAEGIDILSWSYGFVPDVPSLYSPRIFGPEEDNHCDCGKYAGGEYEGIICDRCGVKIFADAAAARHQRLGHMQLACWCEHPITGTNVEVFPVAPIATRTNPDGTPNALGRKYERLVTLNAAAAHALPPRETAKAYYPAARDFDRADLLAAMRDVLTGAGEHLPDDDASILDLTFKQSPPEIHIFPRSSAAMATPCGPR